ncbi:MAG: YicC family protein [Deltaproteobacteria bacterium]|nr:YicC family protein [Deltaproteobacteria bacterium]
MSDAIRSMTGYGRGEGDVRGRRLTVEIKAVNHRFLNFFAKLPSDLQRFEAEVLALVKAHLQRGQVSVFATWNGGGGGDSAPSVNVEAARAAVASLRQVARELSLPGEVTLDHLLAFPSLFAAGAEALEPEELWKAAGAVFEAALRNVDELRVREGQDLAADMTAKLAALRVLGDQVEARRPQVVTEYKARLEKRVEELVTGVPGDVARDRVAVEVAVFADRSDVDEELVRLRSHLDKAGELLAGGGAVGRKLDFLLQELNRETNTIGSKACDAEMSRVVVEMKSELEKIREQVQNLE